MKTKFCFSAITFTLLSYWLNAQQPIDVTEQTIKIGPMGGEETMYFGFAEGDQIVFNFNEIEKKELKEIEILEYPATSKFADYKTAKVENKIIRVGKQAVYKFRFYNSAIGGRVCKIKIQRIPASEQTKNFNSNVNWIIKQDTSWNAYTKDVIVGYDTTYQQKTKKELVKSEQKEELILDKIQRVHSQSNEHGNKTYVFFTLPENLISNYQTKKVVSWAYWVGVGDEANQAWQQNSKTIVSLTKGVATYFTSPLGALAIGTITELMLPKVGEDVYYAVSDEKNKEYFMASSLEWRVYDKGKGVAGYKKFTDAEICQGKYYILLLNDNFMEGINVTVKVVAIVETNAYEDKPYTEQIVTPRYEKKIFKDPVITFAKIPITGQ